MKITITPCTFEKLEQLTYLFDEYRQFYHAFSDPQASRAFLYARYVQGDSVILLAEDERGDVLGFTQIYPSFSSVRLVPVWILNDLFVVPEVRGRGIGRKLMLAAQVEAKKADIHIILLATAKDNMVARKLYESMGYKRDTRLDHYELNLFWSA